MGTGRKAVIFTVKGTLDNDETPGYLPGVVEAMLRLTQKHWLKIAVHHEPHENEIAMAYVAKMLKRELDLDYIVMCGHRADERCLCAKPSPFLIQKAASCMKIDLDRSHFVGSSYNDVGMGRAAGIRHVHFVIPNTSGFADVVKKFIA